MMRTLIVTLSMGSLIFLAGCGPVARGLGKAAARTGSKAASKSASKALRTVPTRTPGSPAIVPVPISAADDLAAQSGRRGGTVGQSADDAKSFADDALDFGADALEFSLSNDDE